MGRRLLVFVLSLLLTALPLAAAGGCGDAPSGKAGMVAMDDAAGGCCDTAPGDEEVSGEPLIVAGLPVPTPRPGRDTLTADDREMPWLAPSPQKTANPQQPPRRAG